MKDRLALIRRLAQLGSSPVTTKPVGMHAAQNPDEKAYPVRKPYRSNRYAKKPAAGPIMGPFKLGFYFTTKIKNHAIFHGTWKKGRKRELGERHRKRVSALTKIAHAKPEKLGRVPPWQKKGGKN